MIRIELRDKVGDCPIVNSHPEFVDFDLRCSDARTVDAIVSIAEDNTVAPLVKTLDGSKCSDVYGVISGRLSDLLEIRPNSQDGQMALALLMTWTQRYPDARFAVSGADHVVGGSWYMDPYLPRFARGFTADALRDLPISDSDRQDEIAKDDPGVSLVLNTYRYDDSNQDISGARLLRKENPPKIKGNRSSGRVKKKGRKRNTEERNADTDRALQDDGRNSRETIGIRVSRDAKTVYDNRSPSEKREIVERIAAQWSAGRSTEEIIAAIERAV